MKKIFLISICVFLCTQFNSQIYTIGSPTHVSSSPGFAAINSLYEDSRVQYIYTPSELQSAGVPSGFPIDTILDLSGFFADGALDDFLSLVFFSLKSYSPRKFKCCQWSMELLDIDQRIRALCCLFFSRIIRFVKYK